MVTRTCFKCKKDLPKEQYFPSMWNGKNYTCKTCHVARTLKHRQKHPEKERARWRMRKYGVTVDKYNKMFEAQKGRCDICGRSIVMNDKKARAPHIDHCHSSGKIRALLCIHCNTMLGSAMDNPAVLRSAAKYIEKHREER